MGLFEHAFIADFFLAIETIKFERGTMKLADFDHILLVFGLFVLL